MHHNPPAVQHKHGSKLVFSGGVGLAVDAHGGEAEGTGQDGVRFPAPPYLGRPPLVPGVGVGVVELRGGSVQAQLPGGALKVVLLICGGGGGRDSFFGFFGRHGEGLPDVPGRSSLSLMLAYAFSGGLDAHDVRH